MIGLIRDNNLYVRIPKNGISTFYKLLLENGYKEINIFNEDIDLCNMNIWGHITEPTKRHTKGVAEFLTQNPDIDYHNPMIGKMLVTGVFDVHTYSIHMMLGYLIKHPITWIPLDVKIEKFNPYPIPSEILDGDRLTNLYFESQNLEFRVSKKDHQNIADENDLKLREIVEDYKIKYHVEYIQLVKNFLEADLLLYHQTLIQYYKRYQS